MNQHKMNMAVMKMTMKHAPNMACEADINSFIKQSQPCKLA